MEGKSEQSVVYRGPLEPLCLSAAHELFNGVRAKLPCNVLLEGKALELIGLQLLWMMRGKSRGSRGCTMLSPHDRAKVEQARKMLMEDMAVPPTLASMSERLGLSINKLQAGFQEMYGTTVFGYLREFKMQKARQLLDGADLNISQVAWSLGYTNLSHFSAAYRKRFGVLPKNYQQSLCRLKNTKYCP